MAMNLRLRRDAEEAVRREAERSHRSQQDVLRAAVDHYLNLGAVAPAQDELLARGRVLPPRTPYRKVVPDPSTAGGPSSADLLDRDDRF
jgi:predicted transcriptional regulator